MRGSIPPTEWSFVWGKIESLTQGQILRETIDSITPKILSQCGNRIKNSIFHQVGDQIALSLWFDIRRQIRLGI